MRRAAIVGLVVLLVPLVAQSADGQSKKSPELEGKDPEGDVSFLGPGAVPVGVPATTVSNYVDLVGMRVHSEDVESISVDVFLKSLDRPPTVFGAIVYRMSFRRDGDPSVGYQVIWTATAASGVATNQSLYRTSFCFQPRAQGGECLAQRVVGGADLGARRLWAIVPKASLLGVNALDASRQPPFTVTLPPGSRLIEFWVEANGGAPTFLRDRLPNQGTLGPFELQQAAANERIRVMRHVNETAEDPDGAGIEAPQGDYVRAEVEPGRVVPIPIEIQNTNGGKRILNLTTDLREAKSLTRWDLHVAPTVAVPGNESRVVNLLVNASQQVEHRESILVRVQARSLGFPDEIGSMTLRLVASVPPSPEHRDLYFHAAFRNSPFGESSCSVPFVNFQCARSRWLNTLEADPKGTHDEAGERQFGFGFNGFQGTSRVGFLLDTNLPRDVVLDPRTPVEGVVVIKSTSRFDGALDVTMRAGDLFIGGAKAAIAPDQREVKFSFLPLIEAERIPAGSPMRIDLALSFAYLGPNLPLLLEPPAIVPKGSKLSLPLVPDPNATFAAASSIRDSFLSFHLQGDAEEFANPGKARAFNLTLLNEGNRTELVDVTPELVSGGCTIELRPGERYRIEAGESVRMGALVRPSEKAKEGEQCETRIVAAVRDAPEVRAVIRLRLVVTTGADFPDDSAGYRIDPESSARIDAADAQGSPGLGAWALLVLVFVLAWRRRAGGF